jgi:diketogulonate reductase-like aldo/keto reductase
MRTVAAAGVDIPLLGFGTWQITGERCALMVEHALKLGYRHIDTAAAYRNEAGVGRAIASSGIPREELFVTTKLWNNNQGHDATIQAFARSAEALRLDIIDLYLIHWPVPMADRYVDTFQAFVELQAEGRIRSIGVSNFHEPHLRRVIDEAGVTPSVNQIELHPYLQQEPLRAVHDELGIVTEAWSPLAQGALLDDPVITRIAQAHDRTTAQVVLRWHLQIGNVVIPKSVTPARIQENFGLVDFELSDDELEAIRGLDRGERTGPDPDTFSMGA